MERTVTDIGSRIRRAREERGLTLGDVANATKISTAALKAIEHNEFARLPGGVFRQAFVRAFAAEVGLNAEEVAREYRMSVEAELPDGPLPPREADRDRQNLVRLVAALSVAGVGLLIGGWLVFTVLATPDGPPFQGRSMPMNPSHALKEVAVADAATEDADEPSLRLMIRAHELCWISAVADGERVVYRLMQPGERTQIEAHGVITLRVGDAGAVEYSINGARGRPLGRSGEVVTVQITEENLEGLYAHPLSTS